MQSVMNKIARDSRLPYELKIGKIDLLEEIGLCFLWFLWFLLCTPLPLILTFLSRIFASISN